MLAAVLYGLYSWLSGEISTGRHQPVEQRRCNQRLQPVAFVDPGYCGFAIVVLGAVFALVNRDLRADMGLPPTTTVTTTTTTTTTPA